MNKGISISRKENNGRKYIPIVDLASEPKEKDLKEFLFSKGGHGTYKISGSKPGKTPGKTLPDVKIIILDEFSYKVNDKKEQIENNQPQVVMSGNNDSSKIYEILMNFQGEIIEKFAMIDHKLDRIIHEIEELEIYEDELEEEKPEEVEEKKDFLGDMAEKVVKGFVNKKFSDITGSGTDD